MSLPRPSYCALVNVQPHDVRGSCCKHRCSIAGTAAEIQHRFPGRNLTGQCVARQVFVLSYLGPCAWHISLTHELGEIAVISRSEQAAPVRKWRHLPSSHAGFVKAHNLHSRETQSS